MMMCHCVLSLPRPLELSEVHSLVDLVGVVLFRDVGHGTVLLCRHVWH